MNASLLEQGGIHRTPQGGGDFSERACQGGVVRHGVPFPHGADSGAGAEPLFGVVRGAIAVDFEQDAGSELGEGVVMGAFGGRSGGVPVGRGRKRGGRSGQRGFRAGWFSFASCVSSVRGLFPITPIIAIVQVYPFSLHSAEERPDLATITTGLAVQLGFFAWIPPAFW